VLPAKAHRALRRIRQRRVEIPVHGHHAAALVMGVVHVRRKIDGRIEIVERALQRALAQIQRAPIVVDEDEFRALLQGEVVVGHGEIVLPLALIGPIPPSRIAALSGSISSALS
jgi:hypothetical protein